MQALRSLSVLGLAIAGLPLVSAPAGDKDVNVVNTPTVILAGTPSVNVGNAPTVDARQNGPWNVSVSGTPGVMIQNGPSQPVPVSGQLVSAPAEPYQRTEIAVFAPNQGIVTVVFAVPSGKRLFVEHVSLMVQVGIGQLVTTKIGWQPPVGPVEQHRLLPTNVGPSGGGLQMFVASQPIRFFADGGAQPLFVEVARGVTSTDGTVEASVSGFLVDVP